MADKENAAAGKRKRVALGELTAAAAAKRKRVALGELTAAVSNAAVVPAPPSRPARGAEAGPVSSASSCPPRGAEADPDSSASSSRPRAAADAGHDSSASSSPPRAAADTDRSASSAPPRAEAAPGDTQLCGAYASDIYTYLRALEVEPQRRPRADYIEAVQGDVAANMRTILVDWLVEVAEEYKLVADTLYLAVSYIDRFLSANTLRRDKLQLLGVTAMHIAAKYEEIGPPHAEDFCYVTDNTYTKQELVKMESDILKFLKFELGNPTIKTFLRRFMRAAHEGNKVLAVGGCCFSVVYC